MDAKSNNARAATEVGAPASLDITSLFERHADAVYRLCYSYLKTHQDAEDATQSVFMKLIDSPRPFNDAEHERAWLIVAASNLCKDILKSAARTRTTELGDDVAQIADGRSAAEPSDVMQAVLALPERYKDCVYMHYYEGYKTDEIASMLGKPPSTVRNDLHDARQLLKAALA